MTKCGGFRDHSVPVPTDRLLCFYFCKLVPCYRLNSTDQGEGTRLLFLVVPGPVLSRMVLLLGVPEGIPALY